MTRRFGGRNCRGVSSRIQGRFGGLRKVPKMGGMTAYEKGQRKETQRVQQKDPGKVIRLVLLKENLMVPM